MCIPGNINQICFCKFYNLFLLLLFHFLNFFFCKISLSFIVLYFSLCKKLIFINYTAHTSHICLALFSELQNLITSNERRMTDLKQLSIQLQQKCSEPCTDTVEIQTTTGAGKKKKKEKCNSLTFRPFPFHKKFLNHASSEQHLSLFSVYLETKINMVHQYR